LALGVTGRIILTCGSIISIIIILISEPIAARFVN
jgi:hypothetical protein